MQLQGHIQVHLHTHEVNLLWNCKLELGNWLTLDRELYEILFHRRNIKSSYVNQHPPENTTNWIYIIMKEFIRLAYMIRDYIVPQWPSAGWWARKSSSCSIQEARRLKTRERAPRYSSRVSPKPGVFSEEPQGYFCTPENKKSGTHISETTQALLLKKSHACMCMNFHVLVLDFIWKFILSPGGPIQESPRSFCYPKCQLRVRTAFEICAEVSFTDFLRIFQYCEIDHQKYYEYLLTPGQSRGAQEYYKEE